MRKIIVAAWLLFVLAAKAEAQAPELLSPYPAGGQRGTTVSITIRGHALAGTTGILVSGQGVKAEFAPVNKDGDNLPVRLIVAPNAPLGPRELHVITPKGSSNPVQFWVDVLPALNEAEPNDDPLQGQMVKSLPITVDGTMNAPADRDSFTFEAAAGETFVFDLNCWRHRSKMDGVLELRDARGEMLKLATAPWESDPRLLYTFMRSGRYTITVHDTQFQGGPQYTYRLTLGKIPVVNDYQPRTGRPGETLNLIGSGTNLVPAPAPHAGKTTTGVQTASLEGRGAKKGNEPKEALKTQLTLPENLVPGETWWAAIQTANGLTLPVPIRLDSLPATAPANGAMLSSLPASVRGIIVKPGEARTCRFHAQAGQQLRFDVAAQRLGSAMDSNLRILDASGKELAVNDDGGTMLSGTAAGIGKDSRLEWKAPATGDYQAEITNLTGKSGPDCFFQLEITPLAPDFRLLLNVSKLDVAQGGASFFTIVPERKDGFNGEITLRAEGLPPGVKLSTASVPANKGDIETTLACDPSAKLDFSRMQLIGTAVIDGKKVEHEAIPREQYMPRAIEPGMFTDDSYRQPYREYALLPIAVTELAETFTLRADVERLDAHGSQPFSLIVRAQRKPGTDGAISLALRGLPEGFKADLKPIAAKTNEVTINITPPPKVTDQSFILIFVGTLEKQTQVCPLVTVNFKGK